MKKLTEGRKMFITVLTIFIFYGGFFIIFNDFDRRVWAPLSDTWDWHMLGVGLVVLFVLALILLRYAHRMDERISREQAQKENILRRQLTQNIAHELKTPVASILGYTETLLETPNIDSQTERQFIERTHSQAERLTHLLQDISTLNRMDFAPDLINKERIDVARIFSDIVLETQLSVAQHQMMLRNCLPNEVIIHGNATLVYSIFRNLVDNAIKYAGRGATMELAAEQHVRYWQFTFSDNGVGVPLEHLSRLFERFYRLDKGRSRKLGGTGLGLSIVKNAVQLHGGEIHAEQNQPHGLKFIFTLHK